MPGKHNAGGCRCCPPGDCWACDIPISITVAQLSPPAGDGCASIFDGTYLFNPSICTQSHDDFANTSFVLCDGYFPSTTVFCDCIAQYYENSELVTGTGYTDQISYWWVIAPTITRVYSNLLTGPRRIQTIIQYAMRLYQQTIRVFDDLSSTCSSNGGSLIAEFTVTDTYVLEVANCVDLTNDIEIPHDSRRIDVLTDPGLTILGNLIAFNTTAYTVPDPCKVRLQI